MPFGGEEVAVLTRIAETLERIESKLQGRVPAQRAPIAGKRYISARSFVRAELSATGPAPWSEILARGAEHGHSKTTLERARRDVAEPEFVDGRHVWRLREDVNHGQGRVNRR